ncbi:L,D-transpeptidase family protein [Mucilaginibacter mali]|uniref:L,D-transpeptidase family protein n=1 Tax=Mucilaginibacter mali TaxID=2740462 RepID=A0A7D4QLR8_9SPHI|nr:L,D-transpeptidase family protein [Mucilaginibacter mali]QKJ31430.1 L,D-transpeptidase family protein [Mucilaginibacter mali]
MKVFILFFMLAATIGLCAWYKMQPRVIPGVTDLDTGIKWNDSLWHHLPANLDTTIIVHDANGTPLKFNQYIKPVFNKEACIYQDKGVWRLQQKTEGARDTLKKDVLAVDRAGRWSIFLPDTVKSWQVKLDQIAHTLNQADRILVLKSERKMILLRKGVSMLTLPINLGFQPVGKKQFDKDGKTPEGIYDVDLKYTRDDAYYKSMLISYPNPDEKQYAKQKGLSAGNGIMVHGTKPDKVNAKDWTAGCIALQNKDMDTLFDRVAQGTVIEIRK